MEMGMGMGMEMVMVMEMGFDVSPSVEMAPLVAVSSTVSLSFLN